MRAQKPKAIFVTGAAGFIGSHMVDLLLKQTSHIILAVDNFDPYYPKKLKLKNIEEAMIEPRYQFFEASFEDSNLWHQLNRKYDIQTVFHFAALAGVRPSLEKPEKYYDVNVLRTLRLLENMRLSGVKDLLFTSSSSVYGGNHKLPFAETDNTDCPISPYAATKKSGEELIQVYARLYAMRAISFRLFTVYGPRQRPDLAIRKFLLNVYNEQPIVMFGNGTSKRDYTHVNDIVNGYYLGYQAIQGFNSGRAEVLNLGSGRAIHLLSMIQNIERALNKKAIIEIEDKHPADLEATLADISRAAAVIGYKPQVDFTSGIISLRDWLLSDEMYQRPNLEMPDISIGVWFKEQRESLKRLLSKPNGHAVPINKF